MNKVKETVSLIVLISIYVIFSLRFFPGDFIKTAVETALQIVKVAPIPIGGTILLVSFLQRTSGEKLPMDRAVRIYLTIAIIVEFLFGIYDYASKGTLS